MNLGEFKISGDIICQLTSYSYIIFHEVANLSCCSSFEIYHFHFKHHHGMILSNIMFNYYCNMYSPRFCQVPKQKNLKLSV